MAPTGKPFQGSTTSDPPRRAADQQQQLDFELDFFRGILQSCPNFVQALRVLGHLFTLTGRTSEGVKVDKRLSRLRPEDPQVHYSLACGYARLNRPDQSIRSLRRALELGFRDFGYIHEDHDLDPVRHDPRFRQLLGEFDG